MGGKDLLLHAADAQHFAAKRDLAGHGQVAAHRDFGQRADHRCRQGDAGGRTVLGDRSLGDVDVNVDAPVEVRVQPQARGPRSHVAQGGLPGLLHHVSKLPSEGQLALARHDGGLDVQDLPAHLGPGQSGCQTDFVFFLRPGVPEFDDAEIFLQVLLFGRNLEPLAVLDDLARHLAGDVGNLALQIPDAGLARVAANDAGDGVIRQRQILGFQSRRLALLGHQKPLGDFHFLGLGIT